MAPERFANLVDVFGRYGFTGIPNIEHEIRFFGLRGNLDRAFRCAVLQRIADQIRRDLLHASQVAAHFARYADVGEDLTLRLPVLKLSDHRIEAGIDILHLREAHPDSFAEPPPREIQHVIDQGRHAFNADFDACRDAL